MRKTALLFLFFALSHCAYSVEVSREISTDTIIDKQSAIVTVTISKPGVNGIAKLIEQVPVGYRAEVTKNGGGKVLVGENGQLKIVWLVLPDDDIVEVQYSLTRLGAEKGESTVNGTFTFVQGDVKHEEIIKSTTFRAMGRSYSDKDQKSAPKELTVVYKVQLGVFSEKKDIKVFKGLPDIHYTKVRGFYKYFTGKFNTEKEANDLIPQAISKGFREAFLVVVKK